MTAQLLERSTFPSKGTEVFCAVSGGPDSLALLGLAVAAGCAVTAVHVDHGIRPGSGGEADVVAGAAKQLGAGFISRQVNVEPGPDLEARARRARYNALPPGALTGHTADDLAETMLLNLLRGTGPDGLGAMVVPGRGIGGPHRPIIALRRTETALFVAELGWPAVVDPSNFDRRFKRNRTRHEVMPLLASVSGRDPVPLMARTAGLLAAESAFLDDLARRIDPTDVKALRAAPRPLANRALRRWLRQSQGDENYPPSSEELARLWRVVLGEVKACQLAGGRRVARSRGRLQVMTAGPGPDLLAPDGSCPTPTQPLAASQGTTSAQVN